MSRRRKLNFNIMLGISSSFEWTVASTLGVVGSLATVASNTRPVLLAAYVLSVNALFFRFAGFFFMLCVPSKERIFL